MIRRGLCGALRPEPSFPSPSPTRYAPGPRSPSCAMARTYRRPAADT
ncbi:hypothetical protein ETAE_2683 [Edwardsiella piscicida]|uniref:Uncharacterized protein n=2 Tax=Edwardsiella TaxID=635 RepID=A0A0H3DTC0_EDWTF|nr:hypothetical protein ETAE_2683 [Edwardsiella tarda EIB202]ADM42521.1 hypothetical protein ETAF_2418 [Edwardsiella tarda FL6-60]